MIGGMTTPTTSRGRLAFVLLAWLVGIVIGPAAASAQITTPKPDVTQDPVVLQDAVVAPQSIVAGTREDVPVLNIESQPTTEAAKVLVPGNAAFQTATSKKAEAGYDCATKRLRTSPMLGIAGTVSRDDAPTWGLVLLVAAAGAGLFVVTAALRRGRAPAGAAPSEDRVARVATLVGIVSGLVGLAVTLFPGVAASERPPEQAKLSVREVHPRITRYEYALKTGARRDRVTIPKIDGREVGNVIWLEIELQGYAGKHPMLQYGLYRYAGEELLPNTAKEVPLPVEQADAQTSFVPIWVGYPIAERFQAQFRLTEDKQVREMAKTGPMNGSTVRYSCRGG